MENFKGRAIEILLVEDNEGDVLFTKEAFKDGKILNNIHVAEDGEIAMDFLRKQGDHHSAVTPDLVLLDINLPKKDGKQVLQEIKEDEQLKMIPVIILTSSRADQDILKTYGLHANSYIVKPVDLNKFFEIVRVIEDFWFSAVVLPDFSKDEPA